jgi:hypothetical protein
MKDYIKMHYKSQAAMEFLMTYGWAIVIVMIMMGTLAYFGVFNVKSFLPKRCFGGPEMSCMQDPSFFNAYSDDTFVNSRIAFSVKNNWNYQVQLISINLSGAENEHPCTAITSSGIQNQNGNTAQFSSHPIINENSIFVIYIYCTGKLESYTSEKLTMEYKLIDADMIQYNDYTLESKSYHVDSSEIVPPWS